eukprot:scaffold1574_cov373-Prasinococcus_capsulatus_cf.AAC.13
MTLCPAGSGWAGPRTHAARRIGKGGALRIRRRPRAPSPLARGRTLLGRRRPWPRDARPHLAGDRLGCLLDRYMHWRPRPSYPPHRIANSHPQAAAGPHS